MKPLPKVNLFPVVTLMCTLKQFGPLSQYLVSHDIVRHFCMSKPHCLIIFNWSHTVNSHSQEKVAFGGYMNLSFRNKCFVY